MNMHAHHKRRSYATLRVTRWVWILAAALALAVTFVVLDERRMSVAAGLPFVHQVIEALGEPSWVDPGEGAELVLQPRDPECKRLAVKCLVYERWLRSSLLVFVDREGDVICAERSNTFLLLQE